MYGPKFYAHSKNVIFQSKFPFLLASAVFVTGFLSMYRKYCGIGRLRKTTSTRKYSCLFVKLYFKPYALCHPFLSLSLLVGDQRAHPEADLTASASTPSITVPSKHGGFPEETWANLSSYHLPRVWHLFFARSYWVNWDFLCFFLLVFKSLPTFHSCACYYACLEISQL